MPNKKKSVKELFRFNKGHKTFQDHTLLCRLNSHAAETKTKDFFASLRYLARRKVWDTLEQHNLTRVYLRITTAIRQKDCWTVNLWRSSLGTNWKCCSSCILPKLSSLECIESFRLCAVRRTTCWNVRQLQKTVKIFRAITSNERLKATSLLVYDGGIIRWIFSRQLRPLFLYDSFGDGLL